jgi:hypothetical protein
MELPSTRIAYVRTTEDPNRSYERTRCFLKTWMRQIHPSDPLDRPRHRFLFGALNACDAHILDIFLSDWILPSPYLNGIFANIKRSDLELRISQSQASTSAGKRILERCAAGGIPVVVSGADDTECQESMLQDCSYIIDRWCEQNIEWYWKTAWTGRPQSTVLTNPKYDMTKYHDYSKRRLMDRYASHGWTAHSGCTHGNGVWRCDSCGGKCKRGRCRVNPSEERKVAEWARLPARGSIEWRSLSADDVCRMVEFQRLFSQPSVKDLYSSIDTFSGD